VKTSHIKKWLKFIKVKNKINKFGDKNQNRVLLTMTDGLGDLISRWNLVDKIVTSEQIKGNTVCILIKERISEVYKFLDTKNTVVLFDKLENEKNVDKLVKELNDLNSLGFRKIYHLEFGGNNRFLRLIKAKESIAFFNYSHSEMNKGVGKLINVFPEKNIYFDVQNYYYELFKEKSSIDELTAPLFGNLNRGSVEKVNISIGVGANYIGRMASSKKLAKIIEVIYQEYPNITITLIGKGSFDQEYADEIIKNIREGISIKNKVNLFDTQELINQLQSSDIYIGYDSGIYNLAFRLGVKCICLAGGVHDRYEHDGISTSVIVIKSKTRIENKKNSYYPYHPFLEELDETLVIEAIDKLFSNQEIER